MLLLNIAYELKQLSKIKAALINILILTSINQLINQFEV